ncbi:hypothetical protein lerEdw1_007416, partial [Lerista edwardsae]
MQAGMATTVTECGNVRIITQVVQPGAPQLAESVRVTQSPLASQLSSIQVGSTKNTLTKALGVVQIVLGVTQISFGIALTAAQEEFQTLTVKSGVYFWIGILMTISFAINVLIIAAALVAIVLHGVEIAQRVQKGSHCNPGEYNGYCSNHSEKLTYGLNAVFIILSVVEIAIAITAMVIGFTFTRQQLYRQL